MAFALIGVFVIGYLLGNLNGSVLISRWVIHDDVRTHGSGNAGFTNFFRNYGGYISLIVIVIDALKAIAACLIGRLVLARYGLALEGAALGGTAVALGHDFPALLGFKGGKGIVCGAATAYMLDWRVGLFITLVFGIFYFSTKYVSLGSVMAAIALGSSFTLLHWGHPWAIAGTVFICVLAIYMHRENISRLLHNTERRTDFFKKTKKG